MMSQIINIKNEPTDNQPDLDAPQALANGDDFEDEDEGILEDTAGTRYFQDAGFKIKQVVQPTIVQRSIGDLYGMLSTSSSRGIITNSRSSAQPYKVSQTRP